MSLSATSLCWTVWICFQAKLNEVRESSKLNHILDLKKKTAKNFLKIAPGLWGQPWGLAVVPTHTSALPVYHSITPNPHSQWQAQRTLEAWLAEGLQIRCWNNTCTLHFPSCTRGLSALPRLCENERWQRALRLSGDRQEEGQQHFKVPRAWLIPVRSSISIKFPKAALVCSRKCCWTRTQIPKLKFSWVPSTSDHLLENTSGVHRTSQLHPEIWL